MAIRVLYEHDEVVVLRGGLDIPSGREAIYRCLDCSTSTTMIVHVAFRVFFANIFVSDLLVNQMHRMPSVAFVITPCRSNGMKGHRVRVRVGVSLGLM